jgi:hypothetical protein
MMPHLRRAVAFSVALSGKPPGNAPEPAANRLDNEPTGLRGSPNVQVDVDAEENLTGAYDPSIFPISFTA